MRSFLHLCILHLHNQDPYGNRVHLPAARADRMLDNVVRQLQQLPEEYTQFYANQLVNKLKKKCCKEPK